MLLRHGFFGNCLEVCCDTPNSVVTETVVIDVFLFFLAENLSFFNQLLQNTKFVNIP